MREPGANDELLSLIIVSAVRQTPLFAAEFLLMLSFFVS